MATRRYQVFKELIAYVELDEEDYVDHDDELGRAAVDSGAMESAAIAKAESQGMWDEILVDATPTDEVAL